MSEVLSFQMTTSEAFIERNGELRGNLPRGNDVRFYIWIFKRKTRKRPQHLAAPPSPPSARKVSRLGSIWRVDSPSPTLLVPIWRLRLPLRRLHLRRCLRLRLRLRLRMIPDCFPASEARGWVRSVLSAVATPASSASFCASTSSFYNNHY